MTVPSPLQLLTEMQEVMAVLEEHNIKPTELRQRLAIPAMTVDNIQLFLNQCTTEQLSRFFYTSGLAKLAEIATKASEAKQKASEPTTQAGEPQ